MTHVTKNGGCQRVAHYVSSKSKNVYTMHDITSIFLLVAISYVH
jgi:hypothetical protein